MSKIIAAATVAILASTSFAFAEGDQSMAQPVSNVQPAKVVCTHDGQVFRTADGTLLVCHMRPVGGVHFKSRQWFSSISGKAAGSNE